jgi:hypothetical protein
VLSLVGIWLMRSVAGKAEASPCASTNDCARGLLCAEATEDGPKKRKRGSGVKQCAKACVADTDCAKGVSCEVAFEHSLGPRGGKLRERAKACVGDDP